MIAQRKITGERRAQAAECLSGAAGSQRRPASAGQGRLRPPAVSPLPRAVRKEKILPISTNSKRERLSWKGKPRDSVLGADGTGRA